MLERKEVPEKKRKLTEGQDDKKDTLLKEEHPRKKSKTSIPGSQDAPVETNITGEDQTEEENQAEIPVNSLPGLPVEIQWTIWRFFKPVELSPLLLVSRELNASVRPLSLQRIIKEVMAKLLIAEIYVQEHLLEEYDDYDLPEGDPLKGAHFSPILGILDHSSLYNTSTIQIEYPGIEYPGIEYRSWHRHDGHSESINEGSYHTPLTDTKAQITQFDEQTATLEAFQPQLLYISNTKSYTKDMPPLVTFNTEYYTRVIDKIKEHAPLLEVFEHILSLFRKKRFNILDRGCFDGMHTLFSYAVASLDPRIIDLVFSTLKNEEDKTILASLYELHPPSSTYTYSRYSINNEENFSNYFSGAKEIIYSYTESLINDILKRAAKKQSPMPSRDFIDSLMRHLPNIRHGFSTRYDEILKDFNAPSEYGDEDTQKNIKAKQGFDHYPLHLLISESFTDKRRNMDAIQPWFYSPILNDYRKIDDDNKGGFAPSFVDHKKMIKKLKKYIPLTKLCETFLKLEEKNLLFQCEDISGDIISYFLASFDLKVTKMLFDSENGKHPTHVLILGEFLNEFSHMGFKNDSILSLELLGIYAKFFRKNEDEIKDFMRNRDYFSLKLFIDQTLPLLELSKKEKDPRYLQALAFIYLKFVRPFCENEKHYQEIHDKLRIKLNAEDHCSISIFPFSPEQRATITNIYPQLYLNSEKKNNLPNILDLPLSSSEQSQEYPAIHQAFLEPSTTIDNAGNVLEKFDEYYAEYEKQEKDEEQEKHEKQESLGQRP